MAASMIKKNFLLSQQLLENISLNDDVMKDEIFGPILPVISFNT